MSATKKGDEKGTNLKDRKRDIKSSLLKPMAGCLCSEAASCDLAAAIDEPPAFDPVVTNLIEEALALMASASAGRR